ncbi:MULTISPECIES: hydroxyacylglutathione hydrolase [Pseudomonas]|jgi:hydroxyacylglutathione hydrolase|uniref:hydroxyacylglutathione hydrolase n=1 Tax=Pseudomonas TaxID=286 RepID=UPI0009F36B61|nr:hydroxyacylglutathione hydrolase [Pseudomonas sp. AP19]
MKAQKTGGMEVLELRAFTDNYIWLLLNQEEKRCAVVDPGDAQPVINWLNEHPQWTLSDVLITHHHSDHVGGIDELKRQYNVRVIGPIPGSIPGLDLVVGDIDEVKVLGHVVRVIAVPGHTLDHVAFFLPGEQILFSGDTLFAAGCGRLFEGTAGQMLDSLERLAALPDATRVYCAHEYTLGNLHFAQAVEPDNKQIADRLIEVVSTRARGACTLPSAIGLEKTTNPFLRTSVPAVRAASQNHAQASIETPAACLQSLREWKNNF